MKRGSYSSRQQHRGFTLVELLASTAILTIIMLACVTAISTVQKSMVLTRTKTDQFREARQAFDLITRTLSQATLNTYWDYYFTGTLSNIPPSTGYLAPSGYIRQSELQFISGPASDIFEGVVSRADMPGHAVFFQAPLGLKADGNSLGSLLNARGYFVRFGDDLKDRPPFLDSNLVPVKFRYRLMEYRPPAESSGGASNRIYSAPDDWIPTARSQQSERVVADNIVLLLISPRVSDQAAVAVGGARPTWVAPFYHYDSRDPNNATKTKEAVSVVGASVRQGTQHLLPPLLEVTMVAVDDQSFENWIAKHGHGSQDILKEAGVAFSDASRYQQDMKKLGDFLTHERLSFRVFATTVSLRNARWDGRSF